MPQIVIGTLFQVAIALCWTTQYFFLQKPCGLSLRCACRSTALARQVQRFDLKTSYLPRQADWAPPHPPTPPLPPFSSMNHPSRLSNEVSRTAYVWEVKGWKRGQHSFNLEKKKKKERQKFPASNGREPSSGSFLTRFDTFLFFFWGGGTNLTLNRFQCRLTNLFLNWWFHDFFRLFVCSFFFRKVGFEKCNWQKYTICRQNAPPSRIAQLLKQHLSWSDYSQWCFLNNLII